jgi:hypothetical protein
MKLVRLMGSFSLSLWRQTWWLMARPQGNNVQIVQHLSAQSRSHSLKAGLTIGVFRHIWKRESSVDHSPERESSSEICRFFPPAFVNLFFFKLGSFVVSSCGAAIGRVQLPAESTTPCQASPYGKSSLLGANSRESKILN